MISPVEMILWKLPVLGAIYLATRISFRLNPQRTTMLTIPPLKTFSALPIENPPPMNEAERVAKITIDVYDRWDTENSCRLFMPLPLHNPTKRIIDKYKMMMT
jgi:hypothetical protein